MLLEKKMDAQPLASPRGRRVSMTINEAMNTSRMTGVPREVSMALPFWDLINSPLLVKSAWEETKP